MKKIIPIIAIVFFTVSIMSCRPRYLRCNKSRRCEAPVKKVEQQQPIISKQQLEVTK